jgi:NADPH:quinone reductase-like Zn-dependent oxidoreductase
VNFADHLARVGLYPDAPKPPCVVGYEVSGTIEAVGDGVDPARVGERVFGGTRFGGYVEIVNIAASDAIPLPESLSFEQGAAIPVNYDGVAALHGWPLAQASALIHGGRCRIGDPVAKARPDTTASPASMRACRVRRRPRHRLPQGRQGKGCCPDRAR